MPKTQGEETKKHGDKLEDLIERSGGRTPSQHENPQRQADAPEDIEDDEEIENDEDEFEETDDANVQNEDVEDRPDRAH